MRSLLFVPGSSPRMMAKAAQSGADVVVLDLEDSVSPGAKAEARSLVVTALQQVEAPGPQFYVRINPIDGTWWEDDLKTVLAARPAGIMLPKASGPDDIERLAQAMGRLEAPQMVDRTRVIAICTETPAGTLSLAARSWRHPRLAGLLWGAEDLAAALSATANRTETGAYASPFALARNLCLLAAHAAGVVPIDAVYTDFKDASGLEREAAQARRDGFGAKAAIHPVQVGTVNRTFSYTDAEREWAHRVIAALQDGALGIAQLDGSMIDAPHLVQARRILQSSSVPTPPA